MTDKRTPFSTLSKLYGKSSSIATFHFFEQFTNANFYFALAADAIIRNHVLFCFEELFRLKILVKFALFTCFLDVWYFKKLHRHTISNLWRKMSVFC